MIPEDGIVSLHDRIRREIDEIDLSDSRQRTRIRCDFEELFDLIKLFLIAERDVYYGYALISNRLAFVAVAIACLRFLTPMELLYCT